MDPIAIAAAVTALGGVLSTWIQNRKANKATKATNVIVTGNGHGTVTDMVTLIHQSLSETTALLHELVGEVRAHVCDERAHVGDAGA